MRKHMGNTSLQAAIARGSTHVPSDDPRAFMQSRENPHSYNWYGTYVHIYIYIYISLSSSVPIFLTLASAIQATITHQNNHWQPVRESLTSERYNEQPHKRPQQQQQQQQQQLPLTYKHAQLKSKSNTEREGERESGRSTTSESDQAREKERMINI